MELITTIVWTANILFFFSYLFISMGIVKGEKRTYNFMILAAVSFYAVYSISMGKSGYPMLALNIGNISRSLRILYRTYREPKILFNIPPAIFISGLVVIGTIAAIVTEATFIELTAWIGGGLFLSAYFLVSDKTISGEGLTFNYMNLAGAIFYLIYAIGINNKAVFWLEIFFIVTSLIALTKEHLRLNRQLT